MNKYYYHLNIGIIFSFHNNFAKLTLFKTVITECQNSHSLGWWGLEQDHDFTSLWFDSKEHSYKPFTHTFQACK